MFYVVYLIKWFFNFDLCFTVICVVNFTFSHLWFSHMRYYYGLKEIVRTGADIYCKGSHFLSQFLLQTSTEMLLATLQDIVQAEDDDTGFTSSTNFLNISHDISFQTSSISLPSVLCIYLESKLTWSSSSGHFWWICSPSSCPLKGYQSGREMGHLNVPPFLSCSMF